MNVQRQSDTAGFTLVEIAFAVAILALAFTTIITIQSNVIATAIADRNRFDAALFAQYLLTVSDLDSEKPEPGSKSGKLPDILHDAGWVDDSVDRLSKYADWTVDTTVESIGILDIQDALRRVDITVSWAPDSVSQFRVTYFIPGDVMAGDS